MTGIDWLFATFTALYTGIIALNVLAEAGNATNVIFPTVSYFFLCYQYGRERGMR